MIIKAKILSPLIGDGVYSAYRPRLEDGYGYIKYEVLTHADVNLEPNLHAVLVSMEQDQFDLLGQNDGYRILWAESEDGSQVVGYPLPTDIMTAGQIDDLKAWHVSAGATQSWVDANITGGSADEQAFSIIVAQRDLPPGVNPPPWSLDILVRREPGWQGKMGWRVVLQDWREDHAPQNAAMAVYQRPECDGYLFTTGAFIEDPPGVWGNVCPPGHEDGGTDIFFGVLYGAAQVGCFTLPANLTEKRFIVNS